MDIDKELIEKIVRENIENKLEDYDFSYLFRDVIRGKLTQKADNIIDDMLKEEIQNVLNNEINTDDGWGRREHWDNFEALFKTKFNEKMNKDWEMRQIIETTIKNRLNELFKSKTKEITEKIQGMVFDELIKEENNNGKC